MPDDAWRPKLRSFASGTKISTSLLPKVAQVTHTVKRMKARTVDISLFGCAAVTACAHVVQNLDRTQRW